jgi:chemotaxis protein MotB
MRDELRSRITHHVSLSMATQPEKKPRRRVKKVKGHGGHHGGAWKVAYADFVTAMMALFLVLWLVSQADTKLKSAIASYFRSPGVFDSQQGGILSAPKKVSREPSALTSKDEEQTLSSMATMLKKTFQTKPSFSKYKEQIKIDLTDEGLRIQIIDKGDRVSFDSGSAALNKEASEVLAEIARGICGLPNPIRIGGHTDRHLFPTSSTYTNWELSADRANAARRVLESNCVSPAQIQRIVGYADTDLLIPEDPYSTSNRRITIMVARMHGGAGNPSDGSEKVAEQHSSDAPAAAPEAAPSPTKPRLPKAKPGDEKTVSVGDPDTVPNVKRQREPAPGPAKNEGSIRND